MRESKVECTATIRRRAYSAVAHLFEFERDDMSFWFGRLTVHSDPLRSFRPLGKLRVRLEDGRQGIAHSFCSVSQPEAGGAIHLLDFVGVSQLGIVDEDDDAPTV